MCLKAEIFGIKMAAVNIEILKSLAVSYTFKPSLVDNTEVLFYTNSQFLFQNIVNTFCITTLPCIILTYED